MPHDTQETHLTNKDYLLYIKNLASIEDINDPQRSVLKTISGQP